MVNQQRSSSVLTFRETDEVGVETAIYICSKTEEAEEDKSGASNDNKTHIGRARIDVVPSRSIGDKDVQKKPWYYPLALRRQASICLQSLISVFLPSGFPHTVTADYVPYQIFDSLQAFSSSIAGLIASRAVLEGIGIGESDGSKDQSAGHDPSKPSSATAVVLLSILQESMGRIATILFAWRLGTSLEPEAKRWRLAADVFNDLGMVLDCLSPMISTRVPWGWYTRIGLLSGASVLRALCGVAAGSSKATLSQHFAVEEKGGNVGELNAKDSSQETVISLLGMWAGSLVLSITVSRSATWLTLLSLLFIHITTNYLAVRSVCMTSLNRQRANIVFSTLMDDNRALTPAEAAKHERIFEHDGLLRWKAVTALGHCHIGSHLTDLLNLMMGSATATRRPSTGAYITATTDADIAKIESLSAIFNRESYLLWYDRATKTATIVLKRGASVEDQLKAWSHALLLARKALSRLPLEGPQRASQEKEGFRDTFDTFALVRETLEQHQDCFPDYLKRLKEIGWNLYIPALETRPGSRIFIQ